MSDVVFILGAGASKLCGAPLMANFLDVASDLLRAGKVDDKRDHFERVFSAIGGLQRVHSKAQLDLNNIESIFTVLELGRIIQRIPGMEPTDIPQAIASLKELIVNTLVTTIEFPVNEGRIGVPKPYEEFAALLRCLRTNALPIKSVSVITFNYDLAADIALLQAGLSPDYIIEAAQPNPGRVDLLKLHGSLNWATEVESRIIRPLHLDSFLQNYRFDYFEEPRGMQLPICSSLVEYFRCHGNPPVAVDSEPVIVPPSWNKADYHQALSNVWARAAEHLAEAESIFVVGYSLPETDSFFRHLYALGSVGKTTLRRIEVFNPDTSGETDSRFRALLGPGAIARYKYHELTFAEAISYIREQFSMRT